MGDDHGQRPGPGNTPAHARRVTGSSVLTPPAGIPVVPLGPGVVDVGPTGRVAVGTCRCGHDFDAHRHWRRGSDCGRCGPGACTAYRPSGGALRRLLWSLSRRR